MRSNAWLAFAWLLCGCAAPGEPVVAAPVTTTAPSPAATPAPPALMVSPAPAPTVVTTPDTPPSVPPPAGPVPIEKLPGAVWPPPGGWDPPPCEVEASTSLVKRGAAYEISAHLRNRTKNSLEIQVPDRCPQGPAVFHGLGENYDYYGACTAGACASPREPVRLSLAPGQSVVVATVRVVPAGEGCNRPLEPGSYLVSFGISTGHLLCGGSAAHFDVAAPPQKPRTPTPVKKCPPPLACGIACPGGNFARDENGCSTCGCANGPSAIEPSAPGRRPPAQ